MTGVFFVFSFFFETEKLEFASFSCFIKFSHQFIFKISLSSNFINQINLIDKYDVNQNSTKIWFHAFFHSLLVWGSNLRHHHEIFELVVE